MSEVEVCIRYEFGNVNETAVLGTVPLFEVEQVIPLINRWGISSQGETYDGVAFGNFVYDPEARRAYFEVVISDEA